MSTLLIISFSIADISYKQQLISYAGRESKIAFYAADTGLECGLFHDLKVENFFPTSDLPNLSSGVCDGTNFDTQLVNIDGATTTSVFAFNISNTGGRNACAVVEVTKVMDQPVQDAIKTIITSRGYNNVCDFSNPTNPNVAAHPRNVERSLEVTY